MFSAICHGDTRLSFTTVANVRLDYFGIILSGRLTVNDDRLRQAHLHCHLNGVYDFNLGSSVGCVMVVTPLLRSLVRTFSPVQYWIVAIIVIPSFEVIHRSSTYLSLFDKAVQG